MMMKKMLKRMLERGMKMVDDTSRNTQPFTETKDLEKVVYNLVASVNQLISISRQNQEIMVELATAQDEILNLMEDELDYQEQEEQSNLMPKSGKIGTLN